MSRAAALAKRVFRTFDPQPQGVVVLLLKSDGTVETHIAGEDVDENQELYLNVVRRMLAELRSPGPKDAIDKEVYALLSVKIDAALLAVIGEESSGVSLQVRTISEYRASAHSIAKILGPLQYGTISVGNDSN